MLLETLTKVSELITKLSFGTVGIGGLMMAANPANLGRKAGGMIANSIGGKSESEGGEGGGITSWIMDMFKKTDEASAVLKQGAEAQKESMNQMVATVAETQSKVAVAVEETGLAMAGEVAEQGVIIGNTLTNVGAETVGSLSQVEASVMKYGQLTTAAINQLQAGYSKLNADMANMRARMQRTSQKGSK